MLTFTGGSGFGGTTILSGNNGYSGGTAVLATTVQVTDGSSLGTGAVTLDWGTIQSNGTDVTLSNNITLADTISFEGFTGGFLDANGARLTIAGNVTGKAPLKCWTWRQRERAVCCSEPIPTVAARRFASVQLCSSAMPRIRRASSARSSTMASFES